VLLMGATHNRGATALRSFADKPNLLPDNRKLQDDSNKWVSLDQDTEFLQVLDGEPARRLEASSSSGGSNPYATQAFVDGEYEYDEYQQAWRYLGFMIDCDSSNDDDDDGSGSYDGGTGEGCSRYVVWAAYVDLDYEGGGIGEYQYYDTQTQQWDATSCNYGGGGDGGSGDGDGGDRCAKMDCHLEDSNFSLLGIFKHKSYDDWMEQLFKHEGMCVWTDTEYSFMSNAREAWPQGCEESYSTTSSGNPIYYDLKPTQGGGMTIGLYTDTRCVEELHSDSISVESVVGNLLMEAGSGDGSGDQNDDDASKYDTLEESFAAWDSAFAKFKICQPCVAHDLTNVGYNTDDDASKGDGYWTYNSKYDDDAYYDDQYNADDGGGGDYSDFDCYDDAGYTNVNQCMKFMAKTTMNAATYRDLSLALQQGTTLDFTLTALSTNGQSTWATVGKSTGMKSFVTVLFFMFSAFVMLFGILFFRKAQRETGYKPSFNLKEPLVFT